MAHWATSGGAKTSEWTQKGSNIERNSRFGNSTRTGEEGLEENPRQVPIGCQVETTFPLGPERGFEFPYGHAKPTWRGISDLVPRGNGLLLNHLTDSLGVLVGNRVAHNLNLRVSKESRMTSETPARRTMRTRRNVRTCANLPEGLPSERHFNEWLLATPRGSPLGKTLQRVAASHSKV